MADERPARHGEHYFDSEIALIYLFKRTDGAAALLANLCERSEGAIEMVWRSMEGADFPPGAENKLHRQINRIEELLGDELWAQIDIE